jgi:hypothetical protein
MKPAEMLGLAPKYEETWEAIEETWVISITPPFGLGPKQQLKLNEDQHERYLKWRAGDGLIQNMLPELNADQRELLITGLVW